MTPEQYGRVEEHFDKALQLEGAERRDYLQQVCAQEPTVGRELLSLLGADQEAAAFIEAPAFEKAPSSLLQGLADPGLRIEYQPAETTARVLGPYVLQGRLGRGGMGIVHRARHAETGQPVALKTIHAAEAASLSSLRREIHALARIRHPGIVPIVDEGVDQHGVPWYAMELVEGVTLRQHAAWLASLGTAQPPAASPPKLSEKAAWWTHSLQLDSDRLLSSPFGNTDDFLPQELQTVAKTVQKPVPPEPHAQQEENQPARILSPEALRQLLGTIRQLCSALAFLHGEGLVHRDLKPDNVLVRPDGSPILVDFGLAVQFTSQLSRESLDSQALAGGTLAYIAPEQARGEPVDARADLYALGCILYELITGRPPFRGKSLHETLQHHFETVPTPPSVLVPDLDPELDRLVLSLLEKAPRHRPGHADAVAAALARLGADAPVAAGPRPRAYLYRSGLVGRSGNLQQLEAWLRNPAPEASPLLLVGGESGVGKTRLVMEAARRAADDGRRVVLGECQPPVGSGEQRAASHQQRPESAAAQSPLHPLRRLFEHIADQCHEHGLQETERLLGRRGPLLALYAPALARLPGQSAYPPVTELPAQAALQRLYVYLTETLSALTSESRPYLLILDDLQWSDELTLGFLEHLLQAQAADRPAHLTLLGTFRTEEAEPLQRLLQLSAQSNRPVLSLARLDEAGVGSIVSDMLALEQPPEVFSRFVAHQSEGNPFFVAEVLRTAVTEGLLLRDELARWQVVTGAQSQPLQMQGVSDSDTLLAARLNALPLPGSIRDLVGRRLDGLEPEARSLVEAAAVLGREVDTALLARTLDEKRQQEALQELLRRQILEEPAGQRLRFVHDKLREVAYERLSLADRRRLHQAAAEAIEASLDGREQLAALGRHWEQAAEPLRASPYYLAAARHALDRVAQEEAEQLYRTFLRVQQQPSAESFQARHELAEKLLLPQGRIQEAMDEHQQALAEVQARGDSAAHIRALCGIGEAYRLMRQPELATRTLDEAQTLAHDTQDRRAEAQILDLQANVQMVLLRHDLADKLLIQAMALAKETGDREIEASARASYMRVLRWQGRLEEGQNWGKSAIELLRQVGNRRLEASTLNHLGVILSDMDEMESGLHVFLQALGVSREIGDVWGECLTLHHIAALHHCLEQLEPAEQYFEQALRTQRRVGHRVAEVWTSRSLAELRQAQGRLEEAAALFARTLDLSREVRDVDLEALTLLAWARVERRRDNLQTADQLLVDAIRLGEERRLVLRVSWAWAERGHVQLARGASARTHLETAEALGAQAETNPSMGTLEMLGGLRRAQQAFEAGESHHLRLGEMIEDLPEILRRNLQEAASAKQP